MQSGDTMKGAGLTVFLTRDGDALKAAISANCRAFYPEISRLVGGLIELTRSQNDALRQQIADIGAGKTNDGSAAREVAG
jgi:hypothetical protein